MKHPKFGMFVVAALLTLVCAQTVWAQDTFVVTHGIYTFTVTFDRTIATSNSDPTFTAAGTILVSSTGGIPGGNGVSASIGGVEASGPGLVNITALVDQAGPGTINTGLNGDEKNLTRILQGGTSVNMDMGTAQIVGMPFFRYKVTVSPSVSDNTPVSIVFNPTASSYGFAESGVNVLGGGSMTALLGGLVVNCPAEGKATKTGSATSPQVIAPGLFIGNVAYCCTPCDIDMESWVTGGDDTYATTNLTWNWKIVPADCHM